MSLPPGFLDELRNRLSLTDVVGRKVMWDARKSNAGKGDMWAPCPFHHEKTASFHVNDKDGYYYCFGCHAKGDAITFVRETENVGFMEAIEILAREAGMPVPERDPQAQKQADRRSELAEVNEAANRFFRLCLNQQGGAEARAYLDRRGMRPATRERFEIGYAPSGNALIRALRDQGVSLDLAIEAGVVAKPDDGRDPYDFFRDRITFPIRDARGRLISFGGRAMDPNARAKYLNGPERLLFDKGAALYNHREARAACGRGQVLVVAEGYMDVIAMAEAGFEATVAPLGTAITDRQLQLMWRMSPEPVIALDGDTAGLRAAYRVIDLAMPLLQAGQSLRFAIMPEGQDPDDLIKAKGPEAMAEVLAAAVPMVTLLWRRETEGKVLDSPERRAALDKALRDAIRPIADPSIKRHYGEILKEMRYELFRPQRGGQARAERRAWTPQRGRFGRGPAVPTEGLKASALVAGDESHADLMREAVVLATLLRNPGAGLKFMTQLEALHPQGEEHATLLHALLLHAEEEDAAALRENVIAIAGLEALDRLLAHPHVQIAPPVRRPDPEIAEMCLAEELAKLKARRGYGAELDEGVAALLEAEDEKLTWRLRQAAEARNRATKAEAEDRTEFDIAENGLELSRSEREAFRALLSRIDPQSRS
ncbi:DNA primase [Celeribacter indicus]|uniref:DNA primase n=1 Tax=Celeribacter indicus TaxID=1208324 RepID=A0A0B5E3S8_9RHOB|nr:DNA primase [Celeribacter indicus]AJE48030.1 DNA primase [Celeribacter indicus]SDW29979.1 DNA primase [Celeribacter indicus]